MHEICKQQVGVYNSDPDNGGQILDILLEAVYPSPLVSKSILWVARHGIKTILPLGVGTRLGTWRPYRHKTPRQEAELIPRLHRALVVRAQGL